MRSFVLSVAVLALISCGERNGGVTQDDCETREVWTGGDRESPYMNPGQACIECHRSEGEELAIAGTVYDAPDQPDNCYGVADYVVEITEADGNVRSLTTNKAGNFYVEHGSIETPYTARIIEPDGSTRQMVGAQTDTDCNSCHTQTGANAAPGRL